jgi:hypothetical protein
VVSAGRTDTKDTLPDDTINVLYSSDTKREGLD